MLAAGCALAFHWINAGAVPPKGRLPSSEIEMCQSSEPLDIGSGLPRCSVACESDARISSVRATQQPSRGAASMAIWSSSNHLGRDGLGAKGLTEMTSRKVASPSRSSKLCVPILGCSPPGCGRTPKCSSTRSLPAESEGETIVMWSILQFGTRAPNSLMAGSKNHGRSRDTVREPPSKSCGDLAEPVATTSASTWAPSIVSLVHGSDNHLFTKTHKT